MNGAIAELFASTSSTPNRDERDDNRRQPILLVLFHELPEFADYLCFRHPPLSNSRYHAAFARLSITCDLIQE